MPCAPNPSKAPCPPRFPGSKLCSTTSLLPLAPWSRGSLSPQRPQAHPSMGQHMLSPSTGSPNSSLEHLGGSMALQTSLPGWPWRPTPRVNLSSGPTTISLCQPLHLHGCISPLQPAPGFCPFRDKRVSPPLQAMSQLSPPAKPKNSPSTSHWGQWGAQGEGNPEHSHLLPPRLAPKSQGKLCNPSTLR